MESKGVVLCLVAAWLWGKVGRGGDPLALCSYGR